MSADGLLLAPDWLQSLRAQLVQPPLRPRLPLLWQGRSIGSVEPQLVAQAPADDLWRLDGAAVHVVGDVLTPALATLALALRDAGLAHVWRNEQLGVRSADGQLLGTVERAVVRPLGIATRAVHLAGLAPDGRHWIQQRALDKPNDPGLWDTLMGGMVPAADTAEQALARETWEEAGLRLEQLQALRPGGVLRMERPTGDGGAGYVVELIDWWHAVLPEGVLPDNQDGEVACFRLVDGAELGRMLQSGQFTLEASGILADLATLPR